MKRLLLLALGIGLLGCLHLNAQDTRVIYLDATLNDSTIVGTKYLSIKDDGGDGSYTGGYDYSIHLVSGCADSTGSTDPDSSMVLLCVDIFEFDIAPVDTLYIYNGPSITSPLLQKINNNYRLSPASRFYANNPSNMLTIRFRTRVSSDVKPQGFKIDADCAKPCEYHSTIIDTLYEHIDLYTGEVIRQRVMKLTPTAFDSVFEVVTRRIADTAWNADHTAWDSIYNYRDTTFHGDLLRIDTTGWKMMATACIGSGIRLHGHAEYTHELGMYTPRDETSSFLWRFDSGDTVRGVGLTNLSYGRLQATGCYNVDLKITDTMGCESKEFVQIQIRVAQNPIKTIFDLTPICNDQYCPVSVGVGDPNSTLNLKKIIYEKTTTKTYEVRTFIPDGPCTNPQTGATDRCYTANVTFTEFPNRTIQNAGDVCSICINMEHTFMGDFRMALVCPTWDENHPLDGGLAVLKYGKAGNNSTCDPWAPLPNSETGALGSPDGENAGGGVDLGKATHDDNTGAKCDSLQNPFGIGLDYCWSRNAAYTLVTGDLASTPTRFQPGNWYISSNGYTTTYSPPDWHTIPSYFTNRGGMTPTETSVTCKIPSDHEGKTDYYSPASDFSDLIGCPLNGDWAVMVCDFWGIDNGWVFNWSMDICGVSSGGEVCDYQVAVDSVTWRPDTNYVNDFRDGEYKGLRIDDIDSVNSRIYSPDTSGDFRINLKIYDEFGCVWDTLTRISTVHTPLPDLGEDVTLCGSDSITLNGYDGYNGRYYNYNYTWEPYGQNTPTITTKTGQMGSREYIVGVTNSYLFGGTARLNCEGRDTIKVTINEQPILSFDPGIYPLEGCEPFELNITNSTKYGYKYRWEFGDGVITTQKEPRHAYAAGQYTLKYYVESEKGCIDSLIFDSLVTVFPNPSASFSWQPEFPTVLHPQIQLINNTSPQTENSKYFWEIQYDRDHPNSYSTLLDKNPTYTWTSKTGGDVTGDYTVRLIARTDNVGPSGHVVQCADTVESTILLINDLLEFPSVVTPNDDGLNDRFVIRGLVEGLGYQINTLDIYDKWGSRVFHADNISRDDQFWDPAKTNSPTGTYFYRFIGRGQAGTIEHNGVIEVLR